MDVYVWNSVETFGQNATNVSITVWMFIHAQAVIMNKTLVHRRRLALAFAAFALLFLIPTYDHVYVLCLCLS